jgi:tripeptide aminopeptidase
MFCEMVQISSESGEEAEFLAYLKDLFTREFNATCTFDDFGNLIVKLSAKATASKDPVLFGVHGDTVKPGKGIEPVVEDGVIRSKGETILGADDKAGIAELVEAIRTADRYPPLEIVVTREEELGLQGARHLDMGLLNAKIGFVIDMDTLDAVVIGGPSKMAIDVTITGKAAHAGMEPEKGISAVRAASHAVVLLKEGRIDPETTVNVGIFQGGEIRNGVPEKAYLNLECRSLSHERCLQQCEIIRQVFETAAHVAGATAEVCMDLSYKASKLSEDSMPVRIVKKAMEIVRITPQVRVIGGGTDASFYNTQGIKTVVIGAGMREEHSKDEHIYVKDMEVAVRTIHAILRALP